ncbi:family 39 glycosyltransferase [Melampsora larici-populina 98AG31]|uniref:Dolichyl-phosphate-mannose--protein mannosyltransferase n=1 Tax=Melampsora larici-populina (strain 98AG31 / pathotype 3-4-7) TaxID=747676 RepID=F4S2R4_MELLP|nr:family 39 glycosyltransferase [Melampsora larici-populina 98AG31]EGG01080.1 family 39 glycosyltransferase [Melampsora larici-populina 98AG31]
MKNEIKPEQQQEFNSGSPSLPPLRSRIHHNHKKLLEINSTSNYQTNQHKTSSTTSTSTSTRLDSPYIYPTPWSNSSNQDQNIISPSYFKSDPTSSTNYTKGWLVNHQSQKTNSTLSNHHSFWNSFGGGLHQLDSKHESKILICLTILAFLIRTWAIWRPSSVVFDEVHFGGFASKYIKSRFFMDVHPPLGKLLITLVAWINGYKGNFNFRDIGSDYLTGNVPYVQMRLLPASLGALIVPISYLTMRMLTLKPMSCLLGSLMIIFENGLIVQSRFILLDSPLLFFTTLTIFFHTGFCYEDSKRGGFTKRWWIWLLLTGLSLGAVASTKWVGFFTIATIGLVTIQQLWNLMGDLRVPIPLLARYFMARVMALVIVPIGFYLFIFQVHLWILSGSGDGDPFMSSEFQHTLRGHRMSDTYADVMIGSNVTIRHTNTQGGYLHSHSQYYPTGSKQQQITLYPHSDSNNLWTILGRLSDESLIGDPQQSRDLSFYNHQSVFVNHTSIIRLQHTLTNKKLHTHDVRAPVTDVDYQNEVSCYGFPGFPGDANDEWIVEIVSKQSDLKVDKSSGKRLKALRTKFRLRHPLQNCYLFSHRVKLPFWAFDQQEVSCNKNPTLANSLWYIETNEHERCKKDSKSEKVNYRKPKFLERFMELQKVMWQTNQALVDHHAYDSRPNDWPFLKRGINFWAKDHLQVYLLGNPFVWWISTGCLIGFGGMKLGLVLRRKRGYRNDLNDAKLSKYDGIGSYLTIGWATHYLPFYLMNRQLFLHHYFPSLYYTILLSSMSFEILTCKLKLIDRWKVLGVLVCLVVWNWWRFYPITYAGKWTRNECEASRWIRSWDFSCHEFLDSVSAF